MSSSAMLSKTRFWTQVALVAITAGSAAGCSSDVTRFGDMFEPTSNQSQIVASNPAAVDTMTTGSLPRPSAYPAAPMSSTTLPPPPGAVASTAPYVRPDGAQTLPPPPAIPQTAATNWTPTTGTQVTLRQGDSLQVLSRRYGVTESSILAANGLSANTPLRVGQVLTIPAGAGAPVAAAVPAQPAPTLAPAPALASAATPTTMQLPMQRPSVPQQVAQAVAPAGSASSYVVKSGDSLGKIAGLYGLRSSDLIKANGLSPDQPIRVGQQLRIPAPGAAAPQIASAQPMTASDARPSVALPQPAATHPIAASAQAAAAPAPVKVAAAAPANVVAASVQNASSSAQTAVADGSFRWPVRGRVISAFGTKPGGERNDGINIEVPEGTPIKAAEGGEVIYAGNELKGFGNLVLVKHSNGFVSAYAHASEVLVRRGDQIMRGQTIAKVGTTGNVARPQLHFEIRSGNRPVDPMPLLSG